MTQLRSGGLNPTPASRHPTGLLAISLYAACWMAIPGAAAARSREYTGHIQSDPQATVFLQVETRQQLARRVVFQVLDLAPLLRGRHGATGHVGADDHLLPE
jgi:hypothetical protein